jgi:hypothetical protein
MKKTFFAVVLMLLASMAWANEIGVGYNNGGPSVRFKWDDAVTSELGLMLNYSNDAVNSQAITELTLSLAPVTLALYRGDLGAVNIGFIFRDNIVIKSGKGTDKSTQVTANDYTLDVLLPEVELNFPGVKGLTLIGSLGVGASWGYDKDGKLDTFDLNLFGISMANVGLIYYFDLGTKEKAAVSSMPPMPAAAATAVPARPAATPAAAPALKPAATAVEPAKEMPVK